MTEKNKRKDVVVLSRGTWDLVVGELERLKSDALPGLIKSARKRNPSYSDEWTEYHAKKLLAKRKAKEMWRRCHNHISKGGRVWLRMQNSYHSVIRGETGHGSLFELLPHEVFYVEVSVGVKSTLNDEVFICLKNRWQQMEYYAVPPEQLVFDIRAGTDEPKLLELDHENLSLLHTLITKIPVGYRKPKAIRIEE